MSSILITGASRGIGRAIAAEAARRGHRVIATARDPRTLAGLDVDQRLSLDVTNQASVAAAVAQAGEVDTVISNAGDIFYAAVEATPTDKLLDIFNLNTVGPVRLAQAVLPQMRARGNGRLLFMSSVAGRIAVPPRAAYASSKWALEALVESMAVEVAPFGVQVALLEPGAVSSGALDNVRSYALESDPYTDLPSADAGRTFITVDQVATETLDAVELPQLPLRIPVGDPARALLAAFA